MKFRVSNESQRLVGRLDEGEDLVSKLTDTCRDHGVTAGQIRAVGHFREIELVHFDPQTQSYEPLVDEKGEFELVSLDGNISRLGGEIALRLAAVFNVIGPLGPQMVGGQLRKARARSAEFVIDSFVDLEMERQLDPDSGRLVLSGIEKKAGASVTTADGDTTSSEDVQSSSPHETKSENEEQESSMSWDEAIAEAEKTETRRDQKRGPSPRSRRTASSTSEATKTDPYADLDLDEPLMDAGDLLDHPKLGRCRILDVDEGESLRIRLPRGRIRKLALAVLDIEYKGEEDGKSVFEAKVRR